MASLSLPCEWSSDEFDDHTSACRGASCERCEGLVEQIPIVRQNSGSLELHPFNNATGPLRKRLISKSVVILATDRRISRMPHTNFTCGCARHISIGSTRSRASLLPSNKLP